MMIKYVIIILLGEFSGKELLDKDKDNFKTLVRYI